jgi:hypothetical protein
MWRGKMNGGEFGTRMTDEVEMGASAEGPSRMEGPTPLDFLRAVYLNEGLPLTVRMRAAVEAAPYMHAKLSAIGVASLTGNEFALRLDRAIMRSAKLIEAKAVEPSQTE